MKSSLRTRSARALAAGGLSVTLLTSAAAVAFAADPAAPHPAPAVSTKPASPMPTKSGKASPMPTPHKVTPKPAVASITVRVNKTDVKSGHSVTFKGRTTGLMAGSRLDLQRFDGKKWVTLKTVKVTKGNVYTLAVKLTGMGKEKLRVIHGKTMSPTVTVTVR